MSKLLPLALLALSTSLATADTTPPASTSTPASLYRLDVSITGLDADPKAAPATYSLTVQEGDNGKVETGANVPIGTAQSQTRMNVGLKLEMNVRLHGSAVVVSGDVEMSTVEAGNAIHRVRAEGATAAALGTAAQLASVYDPQSKRRYEITVTAHRVL